MCKEVDDTPQTKPGKKHESSDSSEQNAAIPEAPQIEIKPEPAPEPEPPKPTKAVPTWTEQSVPPETPDPSIYSNYVTGRDPRLLSSSDSTSSSETTDFPSQTSQSADRILDRSPITR